MGSVEDISSRYHSKPKKENEDDFLMMKEKGSPAFARGGGGDEMGLSVTDDDNLTVSVTDDDYNKSSYRGGLATVNAIKILDKNNKSPSASGRDFPGGLHSQLIGKNQNRTFADSVIDHHHQSH